MTENCLACKKRDEVDTPATTRFYLSDGTFFSHCDEDARHRIRLARIYPVQFGYTRMERL